MQIEELIIRRTNKLINSYEGKYKLTLFTNCLYSLIVLPDQFYERKNWDFMKISIDDIVELEVILKNETLIFSDKDRSLKSFIHKFRNGISHANIDRLFIDKKWKGLKIWNKNSKGEFNFYIEVRFIHLKKFCNYLTNCYLKEVQILRDNKSN